MWKTICKSLKKMWTMKYLINFVKVNKKIGIHNILKNNLFYKFN